MQWNFRGVLGKIDELKKLSNNCDVILLNETLLSDSKNFYLPNFLILRRDRLSNYKKSGGGFLIAIRSNVRYRKIDNCPTFKDKLETIAVSIFSKNDNDNILIVSFYHPTNTHIT